jgi:predicted Zn-dependent protease
LITFWNSGTIDEIGKSIFRVSLSWAGGAPGIPAEALVFRASKGMHGGKRPHKAQIEETAKRNSSGPELNERKWSDMKLNRRSHLLILLALTGLLITSLFGCSTVPITGRKQLSLIPQSQLNILGASSYQDLLENSELSTDAAQRRVIRQVGRDIAESAEQFMREHGMKDDLKYYQWEFELIEDDEVFNAFCLPGGKIAVYTGIIPVTGDENGLAVVLGHEVAHAIVNHGGERMSQLLVAQLGGMALAEALEKEPERTQELLLAAYGIGAQVGVLLPYSRKHESEADHIGLILMAMAGYDPHSAIGFWQRMDAAAGSGPPEFLSTHPSPDTRIRDIRDMLPEALEYYKP